MATDLGEIKREWISIDAGFSATGFWRFRSPLSRCRRSGPNQPVEDVNGEAFAEANAVRRLLERLAPVFLG